MLEQLGSEYCVDERWKRGVESVKMWLRIEKALDDFKYPGKKIHRKQRLASQRRVKEFDGCVCVCVREKRSKDEKRV